MSRKAAPARRNARRSKRMRLILAAMLLMCLGIPAAYAAWPYAAGYSSMISATQHKVELPRAIVANAPLEQAQPKPVFPLIDWVSLQKQNPDVVAWVTVPGTSVDYPIVQASADNPQLYLTHDVNKNRSLYGCPYLDADSGKHGGANALFPVIYGHHLINGLMFSDFAKYSNAAYADEHKQILLMTPTENRELQVIGVNVVDANTEKLQVTFKDERELTAYLERCLDESEVVLCPPDARPFKRVYCFVTCSYGSSNERTLVYAAECPETEENDDE